MPEYDRVRWYEIVKDHQERTEEEYRKLAQKSKARSHRPARR